MAVIIGALATTDAEQNVSGSNINGIGDGLWWALTTVTTVGYGDRYPVTTTGRMVAALLMIGGVALLGVVTVTLASWLIERISETTEAKEMVTRIHIETLHQEILRLREEVQRRTNGDIVDSRNP